MSALGMFSTDFLSSFIVTVTSHAGCLS